jgi:hypothetical protein
MKARVLMVAASAILFLAPRTASATERVAQTDAGMPGRAEMQQNANESAQATTDISLGHGWQPPQGMSQASYGGTAAGRSEAGGKRAQSCAGGPYCSVYFGH